MAEPTTQPEEDPSFSTLLVERPLSNVITSSLSLSVCGCGWVYALMLCTPPVVLVLPVLFPDQDPTLLFGSGIMSTNTTLVERKKGGGGSSRVASIYPRGTYVVQCT